MVLFLSPQDIKPKLADLIRKQRKPIKVKFIFTCKYIKENPATGQTDTNNGHHHSHVLTITESSDIYNLILTEINYLLELVEQFQNEGSGWQFDQVEYFDINIDPFQPLSQGSYIPLPKKLASRKAIINVKNTKDKECFKWSVTSAVFSVKVHPERLNLEMRKNSKHFSWSGIEFPTSLKDIVNFEKRKKAHKIRLLLISNDETSHYCWIIDMRRSLIL